MRRREPADPRLPDERLWRFRQADWWPLRGLDAHHVYRAERLAWCARHGVTPVELRRRVPKPVVADRTATAPAHAAGGQR